MMGVWFLGASIGNFVAGLVTRFMLRDETVEAAMANGVQLFSAVAAIAGAAGLLFVVFATTAPASLQAGVN